MATPRRWGVNAESAEAIAVKNRSFGWQKNPLNVSRDFQVAIEKLLFARIEINRFIVESERALLGDSAKDFEVGVGEGDAFPPVRHGQNTKDFVSINERPNNCGVGLTGGKFLGGGRPELTGQPAFTDEALAGNGRLELLEAVERSLLVGRVGLYVFRYSHEGGTSRRDEGWSECGAVLIGEIQGPSGSIHDANCALDNEPM